MELITYDSVGVQNFPSCFGVCDGKLYWPLNVGPGSVPPFTYIWRDDAGNVIRVDSLGSSQYNGALTCVQPTQTDVQVNIH